MLGLVYPKTVERFGPNIRTPGKITALFALQGMKRPLRVFLGAFFQNKIDILGFRGPNAKMRPVRTNQFGTDRISARSCGLHELNPTQNVQMRSESLIKISPGAQIVT